MQFCQIGARLRGQQVEKYVARAWFVHGEPPVTMPLIDYMFTTTVFTLH